MNGEISRVYVKKVPTNELLIELQDTEWLLRRRGK